MSWALSEFKYYFHPPSWGDYPHPPGNSYGYQNKGITKWAVCICMKRKGIRKGKKGKTEGRMRRAEVRKDRKLPIGEIRKGSARMQSRIHDL